MNEESIMELELPGEEKKNRREARTVEKSGIVASSMSHSSVNS